VVGREALLEVMDTGERVADQAPADVHMGDDRGDRIDGGPDERTLCIAMGGSHQLIELQESTTQRVKERIMDVDVGGVVAGASQPAVDGAVVMMNDTRGGGGIQPIGE
jgi:hypothetical protein